MSDLTESNIAHIRQEYFKLDDDVRKKIMIVAENLADGDEQTLHASVWYFSQKKNRKELNSVFKDIMNNGLLFPDEESESKVPTRVKIGKRTKKK